MSDRAAFGVDRVELSALNERIRHCCVAGWVGLLLLVGCARTPTPTPSPQYSAVPGPSLTKATLPSPPAVEPAPAPKPTPEKKKPAAEKASAPIVTPDNSLVGKVAKYNDSGRFVVLEFPITQMPANGRQLFLYRSGLKVGEVKVTGPQRDDRTVADLLSGEARVGDEVRER